MLDDVAVVLVRPRFPENIGAAARACANFGCPNLVLVAPERWEEDKALPLATPKGADILRRMAIFDDLPAALAGFTCAVDPGRPRGGRIGSLRVRKADGGFAEIDPAATYRLVTNSYLAGGGDGQDTLKNAAGSRVDSGYLEHDVLAEHLKALGVVEAPKERRVVVGPGLGDAVPAPVPGPVPAPVSGLGPGLARLGHAA